jgi:hypothetical protein
VIGGWWLVGERQRQVRVVVVAVAVGNAGVVPGWTLAMGKGIGSLQLRLGDIRQRRRMRNVCAEWCEWCEWCEFRFAQVVRAQAGLVKT